MIARPAAGPDAPRMQPPPLVDRVGGASQPRPGETPPPAAPPTATAQPPVALVAFHGMGQQVRYGTIEDAVDQLERGARAAGGAVTLRGRTQHVDNGQLVACAELELALPDRAPQRVDVYEAYWAPLTEGRISTWQTFVFLLSAAADGVVDGVASGFRFRRYLFRRDPPQADLFRTSFATVLGLALAAGVIAGLWVFEVVMLAVVGSGVLLGREPAWFAAIRTVLFADYSGLLCGLGAGTLAFVVLPALLAPLRRRAPDACRALAWVCDAGLVVAALGTVLVALDVVVLCALAAAAPGHASPLAALEPLRRVAHAWIGIVGGMAGQRGWLLAWGLALAFVSLRVRLFLRQYLGDVAIYVSSHKVDRFYETRVAVQKAAVDVLRFVFGRADAGGSASYGRVVLMGHSLGSVIAYDALNRVILEDAAAATPVNVCGRASALVTYGSPLDKIAFVFRTQRRGAGTLREAMAASRQPLIENTAARQLWWINLYSPFDWIGGRLDYYDRPNELVPGVRPVINLEDPHALTPLLAHGEHDKGTLLPSVVTSAAAGTLGLDTDVLKGLEREQERRRRAPGTPR